MCAQAFVQHGVEHAASKSGTQPAHDASLDALGLLCDISDVDDWLADRTR